MKKIYVTLENEKIYIDDFSEPQKQFLNKAFALYRQGIDWNEFSNFYLSDLNKILRPLSKKKISNHPVYLICLDLEMRLGIEQKQTRQPDYRDLLEDLIDKIYDSRYQFCKETNISQDTLSRILNKKREPSVHLLNTILDSLGFEIDFKKKQPITDFPSLRRGEPKPCLDQLSRA